MVIARTVWFWAAVIVLALVVLAVYFRSGGATRSEGPSALVGEQAPSFDVPSLSGGASGLSKFQSKLVVLNLWASWCPPCRAEMPDLQRLYTVYRRRGVVVVGVDEGESSERAGAFARSLAITYPILIDDAQQYGRVYAALGLPTTAIISRDGVVVRAFDGPLTYAQMVAAVAPLIPSR